MALGAWCLVKVSLKLTFGFNDFPPEIRYEISGAFSLAHRLI
jgi:hypothetical protein